MIHRLQGVMPQLGDELPQIKVRGGETGNEKVVRELLGEACVFYVEVGGEKLREAGGQRWVWIAE